MIKIPTLKLIPICFAAGIAASVTLGSYFGLAMQSTGTMLAVMLLFLGVFMLRTERIERILAAILGAAFAAFRVIGYSYDQLDSYGLIMKNVKTLLSALSAWATLSVTAMCAVLLAFALVRRVAAWADRQTEGSERERRKLFYLSAAAIFAGTLPYLYLYAPGLNIFDTHDQILQFFGYPSYIGDGSVLTDHHPVFLTVVYGLFMKVGLFVGSVNAAQLAYSLLSAAAIALCYAYVFVTLYDEGLHTKFIYILVGCVALYPVLALYAFNMCKDVSAAPFVLMLCAQLVRIYRSRGEAVKNNRFLLAVCLNAFALMLTRKPSLYALAFAAVFLIIAYRDVRLRLAAAFLGAVMLFQFVYTGILLPALSVIPGETREMLSIPFQMTARVLHEGREVTQEEMESISRVLNVEACKSNYDPRLSDPVKDTSNPDMTGEDLGAYLKAFVSIGLRYPQVYLEAWLNMIYGYFYPSNSNTIVCLTLNSPNRGGVNLTQNPKLDAARLELHNIIYFRLRQIPGIGALFYVDTVTWAFLFLLCVLWIRYGFAALAPWMFFFGTLGICMLSPKSGEIRYLMPILYALPVMMGTAVLPVKEGVRYR